MENELVLVDPKQFGLEENKALELTSGLNGVLTERETLKNAYVDVIELELNEENLKTFKELRLKIVKNRTQGIEKWHKTSKEFFLTGGRFVDAIKNKEVLENERMESALLEKEKHFEKLEKARLLEIHKDRVSKLEPFGYEIGNTDFSGMDENMFNAILTGAKTNHEAKLEAEKAAELARQEALRIEAEEKEKQRLELERLRKENEEKDRLAKEAKAKADAELAEVNRLAKIESDKQSKILAYQKAANDKLQAELKSKADAEAKIKADALKAEAQRLADEKKAAKAPDKEKMNKWIDSIMIGLTPDVGGDAHKIALDIHVKFAGFQKWAKTQIDTI